MRSQSGDRYRWRDRIMPRRLLPFIFLMRRMPDIASIVAHTAQIAMAAFMKRMYGFPPPLVLQAPGRAIPPSWPEPAGTTVL